MSNPADTADEMPALRSDSADAVLSTAHEASIIAQLVELAAARAEADERTAADFAQGNATADAEFQASRQQIIHTFESSTQTATSQYTALRQRTLVQYTAQYGPAEQEFRSLRATALATFEAGQQKAQRRCDTVRWEANTVFEATKDQPARQLEETRQQVEVARHTLHAIAGDARVQLVRWRQQRTADYAATAEAAATAEPVTLATLENYLHSAQQRHAELLRLKLPAWFRRGRPAWLFMLLWAALLPGAWWLSGGPHGVWISWLVAVVCALGLFAWLYPIARRQVEAIYPLLCQTVASGNAACDRAIRDAAALSERQRSEIAERRERDVQAATEKLTLKQADLTAARDATLQQAEAHYPKWLAEITQRRDDQLRMADQQHAQLVTQVRQEYEQAEDAAQQRYRAEIDAVRERRETAWQNLADAWLSGMARVHALVTGVQQRSGRLFVEWAQLAEENWQPAKTLVSAIRFGKVFVPMDSIPHGTTGDRGLAAVAPAGFSLPALLPFPAGCSLLYKARGAGRAAAIDSLQAVMLRLLTSLPAGKVRLTIIDPVGLGENFAAFMHLADYDEALVAHRIWTDPRHIEQRLADLSEHMENVIQKYLRNEFQTIEEYNAYAGEIAEPFRFLVIANFPAGFTEAAARRLTSIANSGARCGVFTLISVDTKEALPQGFSLRDLENRSTVLAWDDDHFAWKQSELGQFPLTLDAPPPAEQFTRILHTVGRHTQESSKVEVPFEFIAPALEDRWTSDTRGGIDVPLGRAGATRLQHLKLGHGTAQHALVAGQTGSGKSTLLHALITNIALRYSPEQLELYLIDFKKGVEFKTYAAHRLPHARVIAIESDREFGLSVLERLDAELKARADRFRDLGVQDLAGFRAAQPGVALPRVLLVIDEFQELFVEDDKISQGAALLLDRLVRQGRAFGIHLLLGSQTLGGAYSLARSTMGQIGVRIALRCSEIDAHLILSEDNAAARLLSRAGEAIYNDANGQLEGNHPFQVVWLGDETREVYLREIQHLAQAQNGAPHPQVVFEGNIPARIENNAQLAHLLAGPASEERLPESQLVAWLGEAVAIKDPTSAVFAPQGGSNLLIVGQNDEAALGMMAASFVSLAAHVLRGGQPNLTSARLPRLIVLDGAPADSPAAQLLVQLIALLPVGAARLVSWRDLPAAMTEVATEVARRGEPDAQNLEPVFLFIHGLQRFRDLRKADDDFGFSRMGEEKAASPAKQFATILKEGASLGIHALVWCDSLNNVNRAIDRQGLREFEMRVVLQMSSGDSSSLIDTPLASKLGMNRALSYSEEEGKFEKFRPYGPPSAEWLESVRTSFVVEEKEKEETTEEEITEAQRHRDERGE